jgi:hypothetical protein
MKVWKIWEHQGWGDKISWFNHKNLELTGCTTPIPRVGDHIHGKFNSPSIGPHVAVFEVVSVKPWGDPHDAWEATVKGLHSLVQRKA